ncbi:unnamed protein product [Amoebophrya sp. A25]|nr:unnamed protein product [Amoebophrya sp. A25]|eukprot:GSA25T00000939001.1
MRSISALLNSFLLVFLLACGTLTHYHDRLRAAGDPGGIWRVFFDFPENVQSTRRSVNIFGKQVHEENIKEDVVENAALIEEADSWLRPKSKSASGSTSRISEEQEEQIEVLAGDDENDNGAPNIKVRAEQQESPGKRRHLHEEASEEEALHGEARVWTVICLFGLIIIMSIAFEEFQHVLIHHYKHTGQTQMLKMIDATFKELTILGFVGLSLMCLVKSGALKAVAEAVFERVHGDKHASEHASRRHVLSHVHEHHVMVLNHEAGGVTENVVEGDRRLLLQGEKRRGAAPRRELHMEETDPIATELFELFEQVHMMIFFIMVAFIGLVASLLILSGLTREKFALCRDLKAEQVSTLSLKQKLLGGPLLVRDAIEFRLIQREFFHPYDDKMQNPDAQPAIFDFVGYLAIAMAEFVVELVEIPSVSFATLFILLLAAKPVFRMDAEGQQFFLQALACGITLVLLAIMMRLRGIYYHLLPSDYSPGPSDAMTEYLGKELLIGRGKPAYQTAKYTRGYGAWRKYLYGTLAPNKQEALFYAWRRGPASLSFVLQIALFLQAIYVAVVVSFGHHTSSVTHAIIHFFPLLLSFGVLWPSILYTYTLVTSTGMMQREHIIEEVARKVEAEHFKKYSILISELEAAALVHQVMSMDDYFKTRKPVKDGVYEKWLKTKLEQFHLTMPRDQQSAIEDAFKTWDRDGSGSFDQDELSGLLAHQGRSETQIQSVLRQWLKSGVFRPRYYASKQSGTAGAQAVVELDVKEEGTMYVDEFKVYTMLEAELTGGDFDEDRLSDWLSGVLDKNGDGQVSTTEFLESLPEVCEAAKMDIRGVHTMFKIVEAAEDETQEVDEISISKIVIWLRKYAIQKRNEAQGKKRGFVVDAGDSSRRTEDEGDTHRSGISRTSKASAKAKAGTTKTSV